MAIFSRVRGFGGRERLLVAALFVLSSFYACGCRTSQSRPRVMRSIASSRPLPPQAAPAAGIVQATPAPPEDHFSETPPDATMGEAAEPLLTHPYEPAEEPSEPAMPEELPAIIGQFTPIIEDKPGTAAVADPVSTPEARPTSPPEDNTITRESTIALIRSLGGSADQTESGEIRSVDLSFTAVQDEQLKGLPLLETVAELDLTGTSVSDAAMTRIVELKQLRTLKLKGTRVTDAGVQRLSALSELKLLDLSRTAVTDDGLTQAGQWKQLTFLSLNNTAVTDAGLRHLAALQQLKGLNIVRSNVTGEGIAALQSALPACLVISKVTGTPDSEEDEEPAPRGTPTRTISRRSLVPSAVEDTQLEQIIELVTLQPGLGVQLASAYSSGGHWQEARRILMAASQSDAEDLMIRFRLGEACAQTGLTSEAMTYFSQSVGEAAAHYNIGLIHYERLLRECEQYFEQAMQADPALDLAAMRLNRIRGELSMLQGAPQPVQADNSRDGSGPDVIPGTHIFQVGSTKNAAAGEYRGGRFHGAVPAWLQSESSGADRLESSSSR